MIFSVAFSSILVLAAFASSTGNEFTRGTLRAALTYQPRPLGVDGRQARRRVTVAAIVMALALVVGVGDRGDRRAGPGHRHHRLVRRRRPRRAAEDYVRLLGFVVVYALIGTMVAVLVRSTPIALAIGLLWFGPIENVIGEGRAWAERWFPGLLLRSMLQPDDPGADRHGTALATLAVYAAVCVGVIAVVMSRRDVTS